MRNAAVHFSSASDEWETPPALFAELNRIFRFTLDACATAENAKCPVFFSPAEDALQQEWRGVVWMNPPYGRQIGAFMEKALAAARAGATVVCLVPARTDTRWWHDYARHGLRIFLRGRLRFGAARHTAPFPSALVIFFGGSLGRAVDIGAR